mmetsp:Transcript_115362/g.229995  ORF Transcript_115362/g.229995 Transcript_115362/m.229995 type:complete len:311 (-) Transcript_115362:144-1076(-)
MFPAQWRKSRAFQCAAGINTGHITNANITIVYGAVFVGFPGELDLVREQIGSLAIVGLFGDYSDVNIDVHIVLSFGKLQECLSARGGCVRPTSSWNGDASSPPVAALIRDVQKAAPRAHIHQFHENNFEWAALHTMWTEACRNPDRLFLYFHSKGSSHAQKHPNTHRTLSEMALFREVVAPWRSVVPIFHAHGKAIQQLGLSPSNAGWQWFNFFWARGRFITGREEPKTYRDVGRVPGQKHPGRHYYESWLGQAEVNCSGCCRQASEPRKHESADQSYSLFSCNFRAVEPVEALGQVDLAAQALEDDMIR